VKEAGAGGGRKKEGPGHGWRFGNWGLLATELPGPTRQGRVVLHLGP
jgi:hypothetical protein